MQTGLLVSALASLIMQATPPTQTPPPAPAMQPDIVVEARAQNAFDHFVDQMTSHLNGRQITRWNHRLCPKVSGLDPAQAAFLIDHIAAAARRVGIDTIRRRDCSPDIVVMVSDNADTFTRRFVARHPRLFQDVSSGVGLLPKLRAKLLAPRPVRWLSSSHTIRAGGGEMYGGLNQVYDASHLTGTSQENADLSVAIVDASKMSHVTWGQLGDYLAMVTLARPEMDAVYDDGSILSLFTQRDAGKQSPGGLTPTDSAFLKALYSTTSTAAADQERRQIKAALQHGNRDF